MVKYIQPIFAPNEDMLIKNIQSLASFFDYYDKMNYKFECIFGGYCLNDEMWGIITEFIKRRVSNSIMVRFDRNYGKAYVVNYLTGCHLGEAEYFLTADSDIIYKIDEPDIIARLIEAFEYSKSIKLNPSLISLFQEDNNCHMLDLCYQNTHYYDGRFGHEMVCHPNGEGGVAGGCLFISAEFWKLIGGYKVLGVYAGDDGHLMSDSFNNGYRFLMSNSVRCIHPHDTQEAYVKWKIDRASKFNILLEDSIEDADFFWNIKP